MNRTYVGLFVALVAAVAATLAVPGVASADDCMGTRGEMSIECGGRPAPPPEEPPPGEPSPPGDGGGGYDDDAEGYEEDVGGEGASFFDHHGQCRTVVYGRQRKTWWGRVVWRYMQGVSWCWKDGVITFLERYRWPEVSSWVWAFGGHVSTNCAAEMCSDRYGAGNHSAQILTTGHFMACKGWCFLNVYPSVSISVYAGGGWSAYSWQ